ncbi:MAG: hypothetical protein WD294_06725 [Phycisphaeraceae bacterium]
MTIGKLWRSVTGTIGRGLRAWLSIAPGCSACNDPFSQQRSREQKQREKQRQ